MGNFFDNIGNAFNEIGKNVSKATGDVVNNVGKAAGDVGNNISRAAQCLIRCGKRVTQRGGFRFPGGGERLQNRRRHQPQYPGHLREEALEDGGGAQ